MYPISFNRNLWDTNIEKNSIFLHDIIYIQYNFKTCFVYFIGCLFLFNSLPHNRDYERP